MTQAESASRHSSDMQYGSVHSEPLEPVSSAYQATGTIMSSVINLVNTIVGAGILAMPFALRQNSLFLGVFLILMSGALSGFGLFLQGRCAFYAPARQASFFALASQTYPSLSVIFDIAIAVKCFGVGVSYLIIVGDLMPQVVQSLFNPGDNTQFIVSREFWILASVAIVVPLSYLRKIDSLKYTSLVALISVGYLIVLVVAYYLFSDISDTRAPISLFKPAKISNVLSCFPIIVFAFTCHQNMFSIVNELQHRTAANINRVVATSISFSAFCYILVGVTGYLSFGNIVSGNIVSMYPSSFVTEIARFCIAFMVVLSYPLQCHPCRASLDHTYSWFQSSGFVKSLRHKVSWSRLPSSEEEMVHPSSGGQPGSMSTARFGIVTTIIVVASYITALSVESLELMLAFVGSTGSTSISFILPGLFAYKLIGADSSNSEDWLKWSGLALCLYGVVVMIVSLAINIYLLF
ncbi:Vacuolar amino acid transporter 5 [Yarrowia sp. C11]|nr:Vacuolar amino acid transporter 5 [Yarrowia sp. E02]KAG5369476.1 Vacuolar amino acid transporter 5 [Yarrowia sp. C11]